MKRSSRLVAALFVGIQAAAAEPLAFPGAEGAGRFATGGRGGSVFHVTNLHADGPGSLADGVSAPNRIVVFDVSGIIDLAAGGRKGGRIVADQPNLTIAGQTAPGEGICLKGGVLQVSANNIVVRHLRSRRGFVRDTDSGDAIEVKGEATGTQTSAGGQTVEAFDKRAAKKAARGKTVKTFGDLENIVIDHCSASWATDENLTVTHTNRSTISWCIAAEGLDYTNSKQTPPNHSEGSLWGSAAPDGRATMHHVLYAHNRLRNPRTTGSADVPPVLNFYNNVVYNWSEYASHTGSERVLLNWLNSYYRPGPDTPAEIRSHMFEFHGDPGARIFARGNVIDGSAAATTDNRLAIFHNEKFRKMSDVEREVMKVAIAFPDAPAQLDSADAALAAVLAESGATLPARDAVDLRITGSVRAGTGRIIGKETDLPVEERWPDYRSLPPPPDRDGDGLPDLWERQFALKPDDAGDGMMIAADGYTNLEHYLNNTDPTDGAAPIVFIAATVSLARPGTDGEWRITRTGSTAQALNVHYTVSGDAVSGRDFAPLTGFVQIPAGEASAALRLVPVESATDNRTVIVTLVVDSEHLRIGCPAASLVVIRNSHSHQ